MFDSDTGLRLGDRCRDILVALRRNARTHDGKPYEVRSSVTLEFPSTEEKRTKTLDADEEILSLERGPGGLGSDPVLVSDDAVDLRGLALGVPVMGVPAKYRRQSRTATPSDGA